MIAKVNTLILEGVEGKRIEVEASLLNGLNRFTIVGLPDRSITEAKDRIMSALLSTKMAFPYGQLIVNLTPAAIEKKGAHLDLAICLALMLVAHPRQQTSKFNLEKTIVIGELGLDGAVRPINSVPAFVFEAKKLGFKNIILPQLNYLSTRFIRGIKQYPVAKVTDIFNILSGQTQVSIYPQLNTPPVPKKPKLAQLTLLLNRPLELHILEIAAIGRHNILFDGPPGVGKSTLLSRYVELLPNLDEVKSLEVYKIHSLVRDVTQSECMRPPLRSPHHTASDSAILGGGSSPTPGEITLAHHGILLLDEVPEFAGHVLEALRQPLEEKKITISRVRYKSTYPADFQLLATRNPCPCGWEGFKDRRCTCSPQQIKSYQARLSGALLDRIDIKHRVEPVYELQKDAKTGDYSSIEKVLTRIANAHKFRSERIGRTSKKAHNMATDLLSRERLSLRSLKHILNVARSIADLELSNSLKEEHLLEAYTLNQ